MLDSDTIIVSTQDRLRSGRACLGCRKRKNRCDGERPICSFCRKRSLECQYTSTARRGVANQSYVWSLEEKVRRLERDSQTTSLPKQPIDTTLHESDQIPVSDRSQQSSGSQSSLLLNQTDDAVYQEEVSKDNSPHMLDYNQTSVQTAVGDVGFASPWMSNLRATTIDPYLQPAKRARRDTVIRASMDLSPDNFILPPFVLAKELVDYFFKYTFPVYPVVNEPQLRQQLKIIYENPAQRTVPWISILNMVFAFGCDYLDMSLAEAFELAQTFHRRGAELMLSVCFEQNTVQIIQAQFLVTAHLQNDLKMNRCWQSIGCLVRCAQGIRMNVDPSKWKISLADQEVRKRLWWGIYCMDRIISVKQGQLPILISDSVPPVGIPLTSHGDNLTPDDVFDLPELQKSPSPICFFNAMVQLSHLSETMFLPSAGDAGALAEKYIPQPDGRFDLDEVQINLQIAHVNEQEAKLAAWKRSLPEHLQFDRTQPDEENERQCLMLKLRYLHTRLLMHQQVFLVVVGQGIRKVNMPERGYLRSAITASVEQCAECASQTVAIIIKDQNPRTIGPWWYNVQMMFTAIGTLLALRASPNLFPTIDVEAISGAVNDALLSLNQLSSVNTLMAKCCEYFETLRRRMKMVATITTNDLSQSLAPTNPNNVRGGELQGEADTQHLRAAITSENTSFSPFTDCAGSLDDDWTRLFLEPMLPDFTNDIFNL